LIFHGLKFAVGHKDKLKSINPYMKQTFVLVVLAILVFFNACKKSSNDATPGEPVGPISAEEFASMPPPTFQQAMSAYENVTQKDPALLQNENDLARAMFDYLKDNPGGRKAGDSIATAARGFDLASKLTKEEWKVVLLNPIDAYGAMGTVQPSLTAAQQMFPCDEDVKFQDGKADALRHAFWNALMVKAANKDFAEKFTTAHESEATDANAKAMDLHNNAIGRTMAEKYPTATADQLMQIISETKFYYIDKPGDAIPAEAADALVYFKAKRKFDGTLTGTFTNPDSGGPWSVSFDINQCGNVIRGQYTITRGQELQKRRFLGTLVGDTAIVMNVSDPFVFENPENRPYCRNTKMDLKGNPDKLDGKWTSSNCSQGGVITITK
jgi:hypothetical protein